MTSIPFVCTWPSNVFFHLSTNWRDPQRSWWLILPVFKFGSYFPFKLQYLWKKIICLFAVFRDAVVLQKTNRVTVIYWSQYILEHIFFQVCIFSVVLGLFIYLFIQLYVNVHFLYKCPGYYFSVLTIFTSTFYLFVHAFIYFLPICLSWKHPYFLYDFVDGNLWLIKNEKCKWTNEARLFRPGKLLSYVHMSATVHG